MKRIFYYYYPYRSYSKAITPMITYKYFVYYPKPRGDNRPITPPSGEGVYPPLFGAPAQNHR